MEFIEKLGTEYNLDGYNQKGYDKDGYNREGYDKSGFDRNGINKYTKEKYDENGFDQKGYDKDGYNKSGYDVERYDRDGYSKYGYNREGYKRDGTNRYGKTKEEVLATQAENRKNFFGLLSYAEKLGTGKMTLEEYMIKSNTSLEDLITFARNHKMSKDIMSQLYKYRKQYKIYSVPFSKKDYLATTVFLINGKRVKPTEQDVDKCIEYLKENQMFLCQKTVSDTIRKYLWGELDITIQKNENLNDTNTKSFKRDDGDER